MKLDLSYKITSRLIGYHLNGDTTEFYTLYIYKGEKMMANSTSLVQRFFGKLVSHPNWEKIEEYASLDACKDALRSDALWRYKRYLYNQNEADYKPKEYSVCISVEDGNVGPVIMMEGTD